MNKKALLVVMLVLSFFLFQAKFICAQEDSSETNELMAMVGLRSISVAVILYAEINKGKFPINLSDFVNANVLPQGYVNMERGGYKYSIDFYPDGYKITATPIVCSQTRSKVYVLEGRGEEINQIVKGIGAPRDLKINQYDCLK